MGSILNISSAMVALGFLAASVASASKPGDVNGDNSVDTADLTSLVQLFSSGKPPVGAALRADVNRDGVIDTQDIAALIGLVSGDRGAGTCVEGMWDCCQYLPPWGCCGNEICDEDDDGGSGGGGPGGLGEGGGGDIGGGGTITICDDCDDLQMVGPNYAGPGDPVYAGGVFCGRRLAGAEIVFGAHLLVNGVAGDTPGTVRFRATYEMADGTICTGTHDVQIVQFEPILFRYSAFIQCTHVTIPTYPVVPPGYYPFYGGDGRGFEPVGVPYRSAHEYELAISNLLDDGPEELPGYDATPFVRESAAPPFGLSRAFSLDQCSIDDNSPIPCNVLHIGGGPVATATESRSFDATHFGRSHDSLSGTHGIIARRIGPRTAKVYLYLSGDDPLAPLACSLDGFISFTVTQYVDQDTGAQVAAINYAGWYDPFPAHEIYVNHAPLPNGHGQFNASMYGSTVFNLCGVEVDAIWISGTFPITVD